MSTANPHKKFSHDWHVAEDFNALARLYIRGVLTDAEKDRAKRRMQKIHARKRDEEVKKARKP